jgi:hypothetical protein
MVIFCTVPSSTSMDGSFFSVAITTPSVAEIPRLVAPAATAFRAYSICTSLPLGLNVVSENEYCGRRGDGAGVRGPHEKRSGGPGRAPPGAYAHLRLSHGCCCCSLC